MPTFKRRYALLLFAVTASASVVLCLTILRSPLAVAYHQWRMNAEYNTIFGEPEPAGGGLASYDVTGIDVDAVMNRYTRHRQALVELGVLTHLSARFPWLASDGTEQQSEARSTFVHRMWKKFPGHQHYYLAGDGTFETWVPVADAAEWKHFIDEEKNRNGERPMHHSHYITRERLIKR